PDRLLHPVRNLVVAYRDSALDRELAYHRLAVGGQNPGDQVRPVVGQRRDLLRLFGHAGLISDRQPEQHAGNYRKPEQRKERVLAKEVLKPVRRNRSSGAMGYKSFHSAFSRAAGRGISARLNRPGSWPGVYIEPTS